MSTYVINKRLIDRHQSVEQVYLITVFCLFIKAEFSLFGSATDSSLQQDYYVSGPRTLLYTADADEKNSGKCSKTSASHKQSN